MVFDQDADRSAAAAFSPAPDMASGVVTEAVLGVLRHNDRCVTLELVV